MNELTKKNEVPSGKAQVTPEEIYKLVLDLSEALGRLEARLERLENVVTVTVPLSQVRF